MKGTLKAYNIAVVVCQKILFYQLLSNFPYYLSEWAKREHPLKSNGCLPCITLSCFSLAIPSSPSSEWGALYLRLPHPPSIEPCSCGCLTLSLPSPSLGANVLGWLYLVHSYSSWHFSQLYLSTSSSSFSQTNFISKSSCTLG